MTPSPLQGDTAADLGGDRRLRELHFEWLKLRAYLYDPVTRLPSLPAVLDEVRRRIEGGERLGLLYLDLSRGGSSEAATGWQAHDRLIRDVAETLLGCRGELLDERDVVATLGVRSDELVVFVGLDAAPDRHIAHLGEGVLAEVEARLAANGHLGPAAAPAEGELNGVHGALPVASAHIELAVDPTVRIERAIYSGVHAAREACRRDGERRQSRQLEGLHGLLERGTLRVRYQPIVELASGRVRGVEALCAAPDREVFESPEALFAFAEASHLIVDLERLCRRSAIAGAASLLAPGGLAAGGKLFLNCSTDVFADPELVGDLVRGAAALGLGPEDVVLEVTERVAITEWQSFRRSLEGLRREGVAVAIDDMGSGYSSLHAVAEIEPDYVKFDLSLTHDIHRSRIKRDLLETLVVLAGKIGAIAVAEGIETAEEFAALRDMGIALGQGYFFARPAAAADLRALHFPVA